MNDDRLVLLKSHVYDLLVEQQKINQRLEAVNREIQALQQQVVDNPAPPPEGSAGG